MGRPEEVQEEADRLATLVRMALLRASGKLLQERSRQAFHSWGTGLALALAVGGILATFGMADYYKGVRDRSATLAACAKLEAEVPEACAPFETSDETEKRHNDAVIQAKKARDEVERARALPLTPAKRKLLALVVDCKKAVVKLKPSLSDDAKAATIALCAVEKR